MIRMLALDVDGTLAVRGDEVSSATRDALHRAARADVEIVIATGRRFRTARRVVEALGLPTPLVCLGGALIKSGALTTLHACSFASSDYRAVGALLRAHGLTLVGQRDSHAHGGADFVVDASRPWSPEVERYVAANAEYCERIAASDEVARDDILVIGTFGSEPILAKVRAELAERHPGRFESVVVSAGWESAFYLEIIPARVSKWAGVLMLAQDRGVAPESICAVGDERNDLPMVEGAGVGVAMGNAHADLKSVADWVCAANDRDGIVEVVDHILGAR